MYIMLKVIDGLTILQTEKSLPVKPPQNTISNTDGTNGGFSGASVVSE